MDTGERAVVVVVVVCECVESAGVGKFVVDRVVCGVELDGRCFA